MKSIKEILDNYSKYETYADFDSRFSKRFIDFLTIEEMKENVEKVKYQLKEEYRSSYTPKEWTEENVINQLKEDVEFGWEKCQDERGISADLMSEVVLAWCRVLENGLENTSYGWYGDNIFCTVDKFYNFGITTKE